MCAVSGLGLRLGLRLGLGRAADRAHLSVTTAATTSWHVNLANNNVSGQLTLMNIS